MKNAGRPSEFYELQKLRHGQKSPLAYKGAKLSERDQKRDEINERQPSLKRKSGQPVFRAKKGVPSHDDFRSLRTRTQRETYHAASVLPHPLRRTLDSA